MDLHGGKSHRSRHGLPWVAVEVGKVSLRNGDENVFYEADAAARRGAPRWLMAELPSLLL